MVLLGEVRENRNQQFPYIAVVSDERGRVIATLPALSRILGEMYILEVCDALDEKIAARKRASN